MWIEPKLIAPAKEEEESQYLLTPGAAEQKQFETSLISAAPKKVRLNSPYVPRFDPASLLLGLPQLMGQSRCVGNELNDSAKVRVRPITSTRASQLAALMGVSNYKPARRLASLSDLDSDRIHIFEYFQKNPYKSPANNRLSPELKAPPRKAAPEPVTSRPAVSQATVSQKVEPQVKRETAPHSAPRPKQQTPTAATNPIVERMSACLTQAEVRMPLNLGIQLEKKMMSPLERECAISLNDINLPNAEPESYTPPIPSFQTELIVSLPSVPIENPDQEWLASRFRQIEIDARKNFESILNVNSAIALRYALEEASAIYTEIINVLTEGYGKIIKTDKPTLTEEEVVCNFDGILFEKAQTAGACLDIALTHDEATIFTCLPSLKKEMRISSSLLQTRSASDIKVMRYVIESHKRGPLPRKTTTKDPEHADCLATCNIVLPAPLTYESIKTKKTKTQSLLGNAWTEHKTEVLKPVFYTPLNRDAISYSSIRAEEISSLSGFAQLMNGLFECLNENFPHLYNFARIVRFLFSRKSRHATPSTTNRSMEISPISRVQRLALA